MNPQKTCPLCGALPGQPCTTEAGKRTRMHSSRRPNAIALVLRSGTQVADALKQDDA